MHLCLKCQPVNDAYTAVIYDRSPPNNPVNPSKLTKKEATNKETAAVTTTAANATEVMSSTKPKPKSKQGTREKQRLLCTITSSGYCVVYRNNGKARFICTEYGGCLCDRAGAVYYQWKWDELKLKDYEKFKNELITDVIFFVFVIHFFINLLIKTFRE